MRPIVAIVSQLALTTALVLGMQSAVAQSAPALVPAGSAVKGKELYDARCSACHSVDAHRVGPMHLGVVGRKAGSAAGYSYSEAVRNSKTVWGHDTLVAWLTNPEALIPGQHMGYSMDNAQDREDVVEYLATLKVNQ